MESCPLCHKKEPFVTVKGPDARRYLRCEKCMLIFTGAEHLPSADEEKERYLEHNNGIQYPGYVKFLNQAIEPAILHLTAGMRGLDYGCGPTPTLSLLLKQRGFICNDYDPIFFPELPAGPFDFIFGTECFEHFFNPARDIRKVYDLLKPGGVVVIMTHPWDDKTDFTDWYYARDLTHVSFYHSITFRYIEEHFGLEPLAGGNERVVIMKRHQLTKSASG